MYRNIEKIFTEEEEKMLNSFIEDEDYTVLDANIIQKLEEKDNEEFNNRTCSITYWQMFVDWLYSWFE